jgi:hypothetical protein
MNEWQAVYDEVVATINRASRHPVFFRGHRDADWKLVPTLSRCKEKAIEAAGLKSARELEWNLYFGFTTKAGNLLPPTTDSWAHLLAMQHHGVPTRLLDWTECFAIALYFALKHATGDAAIWILDPCELNRHTFGTSSIVQPTVFGSYYDLYIGTSKSLPNNASAVALYPLRHNPRAFNQQAGFTLHNNLEMALSEVCAEALTKIVVPVAAQPKARTFLRLAGISEYSLFPDLDGLAREITDVYVRSKK